MLSTVHIVFLTLIEGVDCDTEVQRGGMMGERKKECSAKHFTRPVGFRVWNQPEFQKQMDLHKTYSKYILVLKNYSKAVN